MTTKHTPGPWGFYNLTPGNLVVETREGRRIADVAGIDFEADANARLIATAPDLLEAASWARDILVQLKDAGHSVEIELTACERAIAKAEGRE